MAGGCKCTDVLLRVKREREAVYREIWDRVMNAEKRIVPIVMDATCCHSQLAYNMYAWLCVTFLNKVPSVDLKQLEGKVCCGVGCKDKDMEHTIRALALIKSHRAVVARMHVRHQRALEPLHKECCDLVWHEVATLRTPIRDFSQILYNKADEKFFNFQLPLQGLTTNPHGIVHIAISNTAVSAAKDAAWAAWRVWFLDKVQHIKAKREANARKLLNTINW